MLETRNVKNKNKKKTAELGQAYEKIVVAVGVVKLISINKQVILTQSTEYPFVASNDSKLPIKDNIKKN